MPNTSSQSVYSLKQANTALVLLLLAYILSFIDRNVMALKPYRQALNAAQSAKI